jgi:pyruvate formate lyase activating enzyme
VGICSLCGRVAPTISDALGLCADCVGSGGGRVEARIAEAHRATREAFGLPPAPPRERIGVACTRCVNRCVIGEGAWGYCGVRANEGGRLRGGDPDGALVSWYHDPLPTNCVADWVCAGCTGAGYPDYSLSDAGPEYGHDNLAVFYSGCSFDCLFCQNWHHRPGEGRPRLVSADELARAVGRATTCVCYFGGDPAPQIEHALAASRKALELRRQEGERRAGGRGLPLRICWETNGSADPHLIREAFALSVESGGCVKFDLKAHDETLHRALTGVTNRRTLENFTMLAEITPTGKHPPPLVASTLLVPGYVEAAEVRSIARFIARLDETIPYSLLGFHPDFVMTDLPTTSRRQARECEVAAREEGLTRVHVGNVHLLL